MSKGTDVICKTLEIQTEPSPGNPSGVVLINESDFNPTIHTMVGGNPEPVKVTEVPKVDATKAPEIEEPKDEQPVIKQPRQK